MILSDFIPVLVAILVAGLGVFTYAWQEKLKRETALNKRKQGLYENLMRNLFELLAADTGAERSKYITDIEKSWLFAPDEVLHACYDFLEVYDDLCCSLTEPHKVLKGKDILQRVRADDGLKEKLGKSLARIFLAMRKDMRASKISQAWALDKFKIYSWGIVSAFETEPQGLGTSQKT